MKILVIDRSKTHRHVLGRELSKLGHCCELVVDNERAIDAIVDSRADNESFDLILFEVDYSSMSNFEFLFNLQKQDKFCFRRSKVVMVTAEATTDFLRLTRELDLFGWVVKPLCLKRIKGVVKRVEQGFDFSMAG